MLVSKLVSNWKELDAAWRIVPASPLRRIAARLLDYLLVAAYLILLAALSIGLRLSPIRADFDSAMSQPLTAELLGFFLLTLPVVLYFRPE